LIRLGCSADEPEIRDFTHNTFDWGDYVADSFPSWIEDMEHGKGVVYVAVEIPRKKVVGIHHSKFLSPEEVWFEGIRVHADYRRGGIGRRLTAAAIKGAREKGVKICRAAIDHDNFKSQGLAREVGFEPVIPIVQFEASLESIVLPGCIAAEDGEKGSVSLRNATACDAHAIFHAVSREMSYIGDDFTWWRVTPENIARVIDQREMRIAVDSSGRLIAGATRNEVHVDEDGDTPTVYGELSSAFGEPDGVMAVIWEYAAEAAKRAVEKGFPGKVNITCEAKSPVTRVLPAHNFKERYLEGRRDEIWLWELLLAD